MKMLLGFDDAEESDSDDSGYVVSYVCGTHGTLQPDGTWLVTDDHQPGCEHETTQDRDR